MSVEEIEGYDLDGLPTGEVRYMVARKSRTPAGVWHEIRVDDVDAMPIDPLSGHFSRDDYDRDVRSEKSRRFRLVRATEAEYLLYVKFLKSPRSKHLYNKLEGMISHG